MVPKVYERGFSAIELLVVCLIIVAIAAIAIPNAVTAYNGYQLQIAATSLEQQLNRCRQEAVRANLPTKIKVNSNNTRIDLNHDDTFDSTDEEPIILSESASVTSFTPNTGIVTYTSRGEMPVGGNAAFTLTYAGRSRVVAVDPRGAVSIGPEVAAG